MSTGSAGLAYMADMPQPAAAAQAGGYMLCGGGGSFADPLAFLI